MKIPSFTIDPAEVAALIRRCQSCGRTARTVRHWAEGKVLHAELSCGCTSTDEVTIRERLALEDGASAAMAAVHTRHMKRAMAECPCGACGADVHNLTEVV